MSEPRRIGEILDPTLAGLQDSDQARAYAAWALAAGEQVTASAAPRGFRRGVLTVDCRSSVWANELTYLSGQLLRRMREVSPDHPVERLRFVVGRGPDRSGDDQAPEPRAVNDEGPDRRRGRPRLKGAKAQADEVRDERLRAAIQALLRTAAEDPAEPSDTARP